ncbi:MAG: hypothetical protein CVU96_01335 [Firmicutes bacterium HGW-Firmicutes-20]|jgi:glycerophosphoryl diester phosphodiesterase|nr:MAG: hypothetical protein CVU96_01335 [Firmicutes bacterium HGW-Firmicutes-20]PKM67619.1 MAG: hypothetical protein CVU94_06280 [Firmicutes bacterium HGW-Firmicutes-19]
METIPTKSQQKPKLMVQVLDLFSQHFTFLFISQSIIILFGILVIVPLFTYGFEIALTTSGLSYLSLSNLLHFFLNPFSLTFLFIVFMILSIFVVFEDYFLKEFVYHRYHQLNISKSNMILSSMKLTYQTFTTLRIRHILSVWVLMVSFNLPYLIFTTRFDPMMRYIASSSSQLLIWLIMFGIYIFSISIVNRHDLKIIKKHLIYNITQGALLFVLYVMILVTAILLVSILIPPMIAVAAFMSMLNRINQGYTIFLFIVSTIFHYAVYMVFSSSTLIKDESEITDQLALKKETLLRSPLRKILVITLIIFFVMDVYVYLGIIRNGSMLQMVQFDQITITSHRGYSYSYPENTIVAIQRAIEVYTDYVEVDIRVTQDNEFVLLHDDNLMRTTGLNKSVRSLPLETIQSLDAGKWLNSKFAGTSIPTLREALEFTKGKVGVNLDLKLTESQSYVIPNLVALIDEFEMQYQVLLTSTCLSCLEKVKELNSNIQTGYITYRITPVLLNNPSIDVISMKSSFVTQSIVSQVHNANKKILVWTVNSRSEIERMSRLGVNNIITDRPFYAKDVIFKLTADRFIVTLLKVILDS